MQRCNPCIRERLFFWGNVRIVLFLGRLNFFVFTYKSMHTFVF
jgi:hypothetical protein